MNFLYITEWKTNTDGYSLSNENKIATKDSAETSCIQYSKGKAYKCGHCIVFKVVQEGKLSTGDGIGITISNKETDSLLCPGALFVTTEGLFYMIIYLKLLHVVESISGRFQYCDVNACQCHSK